MPGWAVRVVLVAAMCILFAGAGFAGAGLGVGGFDLGGFDVGGFNAARPTAARAAAPASQTIKVIAREFAYEPKEFTARAGEAVFTVVNEGAIEHNFLIDDPAKKTVAKIAVISPGETDQVRVTLRAGSYAVYCDLPGHREAGMAAPLRVRD